jgi:RNA polymerase sigma-70 factor (ECF subfamily)
VHEEDDLVLLERWRAGENAAGQALFARYFEIVFRFFTTKCRTEAEELTQSTFLSCMKARDQFRAQSSFKTYVFTIARNELHHHLRTKARKLDRLDFEVSSIMDITTSIGSKLARREEHTRLLDALQRLPVEMQTLLELHYWEEIDIGQLSQIFETSTDSMRARLYRARNALRQQILSVAPPEAVKDESTMDAWIQQQEKATRSHHVSG